MEIEVIKLILEISKKQISDIESRLHGDFKILGAEEQKEFQKNEAILLYLKNFWNQYEFLTRKLETENENDFHFFLSTLRTLIELYGELLYLLNQDLKTQIGLFIGNHLLFLSDYYRFVTSKSPAVKAEYDRFQALANNVLVSESISFPIDIDTFSKRKFLDEKGFAFPSYEQIFQKDYFKELSKESLFYWKKDTAENFYNKYYRTFSDYTHRGFSNQAGVSTGTEKFWIIQFLFLIAQLIIELCNKKVFNPSHKPEYDALNAKIQEIYPKILESWNVKRRVQD
jgi:hypothetical protein